MKIIRQPVADRTRSPSLSRPHVPTIEVDDLSLRPLVRLRDIVKTYHTKAGQLTALDRITLDVRPGEFLGITGKSGAGKSTLVNMIAGIDRLTSGQVWVNQVSVHELDENQMALWRGRNVGIIYQSFELMPSLSLLDNVMLPMDFCGLYHAKRSPERAMELLTQVGLREQVVAARAGELDAPLDDLLRPFGHAAELPLLRHDPADLRVLREAGTLLPPVVVGGVPPASAGHARLKGRL